MVCVCVCVCAQVLTQVCSSSLVALVLEVALMKLGMYIIAAPACSLFDLLAYASYKFVGLVINTCVG